MSAITITEVGLRDGLQNQLQIVRTEAKLRIFDSLTAAGLKNLEATSFVSPTRVPQLADADSFAQRLPQNKDLELSALIASQRGYERAKRAGIRRIAVVLAASETLNQKNIGLPIVAATKLFHNIIAKAGRDGIGVRAYIAAAMGCPYEGHTPPSVVARLADTMAEAGAEEIAIADTIGAGHPAEVKPLLKPLLRDYGSDKIAVHFHDTRGLGMALAWAALECGVRRFDSSIGGLGGCPFAPGASGNVATEDLVFMLREDGFDTGIDFPKLLEAVQIVRNEVDRGAGGRIVSWATRNLKKETATAGQ